MAGNIDMQSNLWEMYMAMDPYELDESQLNYEFLLREIPTYGQLRRKAKALTESMQGESRGDRTLDHLYRSPIPVDIDLMDCARLTLYLDTESRKKRIDFYTLDTLWSRVVHLIARLNRIITAGAEMKRLKFEMLFWAETIRETIERQRDPHGEFLPAVEIDVCYQRIPSLANVAKENGSSNKENAQQKSREENEMEEIIRRLSDVSPIQRTRSVNFSTPLTPADSIPMPHISVEDIENSVANQTTNGMPTQAQTNDNGQANAIAPQPITYAPRFSTNGWRDPSTATRPKSGHAPHTETPVRGDDKFARRFHQSKGSYRIQMESDADQETSVEIIEPIHSQTIAPIGDTAIPKTTYTGTIPKQRFVQQVAQANDVQQMSVAPMGATYTITAAAPITYPSSQPMNRETTHAEVIAASAEQIKANRSYSQAVYDAIDRRRRQREEATQQTAGANAAGQSIYPHQRIAPQREQWNLSQPSLVLQSQLPATRKAQVLSEPRTIQTNLRGSSDEMTRMKEVCRQMAIELAQLREEQANAATANGKLRGGDREDNYRHRENGNNNNNRHRESSDSSGNYPNSTDTRENTGRNPRDEHTRRSSDRHGREPSSPDDSPDSSDNGSYRRRNNGNGRNEGSHNQRRNGHVRHGQNDQRDRNNGRNRELTTQLKPIAINNWRVCFSGDPTPVSKYDVNIHKFLALLKTHCQRAHISQEAVLEHVLHLLAGSALDWYQSEGYNIHTWDEFERRLKAHFLPLSYDYELIAQANRRKQGRKESVAIYVNAMRLIFGAMSDPLKAEHQLFLVRQNLHPQYSSIVASHSPRTINDVLRICKEIECSRNANAEPEPVKPRVNRPNFRGVNSAERVEDNPSSSADENSSNDEEEKPKVAAAKSEKRQKIDKRKPSVANKESKSNDAVEAACYNCGSEDHLQRNCTFKWPKHCFRCGAEGVILRDCPKCKEDRVKMAKNAKVNLAQEQRDSPNEQAS